MMQMNEKTAPGSDAAEVNVAGILDEIGPELAREMLYRMMLTRAFEEKALELYSLGQVHGTMHLSLIHI